MLSLGPVVTGYSSWPGHMFSIFLSFSPFPGRDVITWSSGDLLLTAGPVMYSLAILVSLLLQVEM
jgi:hypothetical protein